ncbi:MAG: hypothetical protein J5928_00410, partial [Firmicutes bacterium]|nr:hypothetical protein [Bacillota bacterium]
KQYRAAYCAALWYCFWSFRGVDAIIQRLEENFRWRGGYCLSPKGEFIRAARKFPSIEMIARDENEKKQCYRSA